MVLKNRTDRKILYCFLFLLCLSVSIFIGSRIVSADTGMPEGSEPDVSVYEETDLNADFYSRVFDINDGLISLEINTIEQTSDGYIWAGAYSGLYRYNGTFFERMDLDSRINNVIYLYEDDHSRLWIGTNDSGVACMDHNTGELDFITVEQGLPSNSIRSICEDPSGNIYISTAAELARVSPDGSVYVYDDRPDISRVYSLDNLAGDMVGGVTASGIPVIISGDELITGFADIQDKDLSYTTFAGGSGGNIMLGTSGSKIRHYVLDPSTGKTRIIKSIELKDFNYTNFIRYSREYGGYFAGGSNGLVFIDEYDHVTYLSKQEFTNSVNDAIVDYQGNIWFASTKQGIMKMSHSPFSNVLIKAGEEEKVVNAMLCTGNRLYAGTDNGINIIDISSNKPLYDRKIMTSPAGGSRVRHIMQDSRENLWISTYGAGGLVYISADESVVREYNNTQDKKVLGNRFRFTLELKDGTILAASADGLNFINTDGEVVKTLGTAEGLSVPQILTAVITPEGSVMAGSDGDGIYVIEDMNVTGHIGTDQGLGSLVVLKIVPYEQGYIFVTSNGLYYMEDSGIHRLNAFPYSNNYDVWISSEGDAWISSSAGIYIVDAGDLIADKEYDYILLNKNRGFDTTLTANSFNALSGDTLYLCCSDGVRSIDTSVYNDSNDNYSMILSSVTADNAPVPYENGAYILPSGNSRITILPAILNYSLSNPLVKIELEGSGEAPVYAHQVDMSSIQFSSLPFGDYSLRLSVVDELSGAEIRSESFAFHKDAELYERLIFKIYLVCVGVMLVAFLAWMIAKMSNMAIINRQYDQIREAKEEAEYANQAKSRFLANMSHEIRTPINAVLGMDEMILRESREPAIKNYAADIYTAGNTLLSIINDILDSSKIESGKMEIIPVEYDLKILIHDLVNMITPRVQDKGLTLTVEADPGLPSVLFGDDVRIRQVVTNILTNAVKYTPEGSVIFRISRADDATSGDGYSAVKDMAQADKGEDGKVGNKGHIRLRFEVEDTGIGIKEEDLPKLFEAFQRIEEGRNRNIEGTGLGMSITMQLLHMMGSRLEVKSTYGEGSTFWFYIDQTIIEDEPIGSFEESDGRGSDAYHYEGRFTAPDAHVLVVDDNDMNRKVFKSLLKPLRMDIDEAGDGMEALNLASEKEYDCVFMDHMMPDMDGVETMKRMRNIPGYNDIPIYVLTANAVSGAKEEYMEAGFDGFISKPVVSEKLENAIREALPSEKLMPFTEEDDDGRGLNHSENDGMSSSVTSLCTPPDDLPMIEGLDWDYAYLHLPGDELVSSAISGFYETIDLQADKLDASFKELDTSPDAYRIQVHGMKSAAAIIGIVPLAGMAKVLEFAARDNDTDTVYSLHGTFIREWRSYQDKLKELPYIADMVNAYGDLPPADSDMLKAMLTMLETALDDFDVDACDDIIKRMKDYSYPESIRDMIMKLYGAVSDLDTDEASIIIHNIREEIQ